MTAHYVLPQRSYHNPGILFNLQVKKKAWLQLSNNWKNDLLGETKVTNHRKKKKETKQQVYDAAELIKVNL